MPTTSKPRRLGLIGTLIGLLALGVAIFHFFFGPLEPPPPLETVVAETTVKLKNALAATLEGKEYVAPAQESKRGLDKLVDNAVIVLGFFALALGVIGFVQREEWRASTMAVALGGGAIAFQFAVVVVGVILAIILIGFILSAVNIS